MPFKHMSNTINFDFLLYHNVCETTYLGGCSVLVPGEFHPLRHCCEMLKGSDSEQGADEVGYGGMSDSFSDKAVRLGFIRKVRSCEQEGRSEGAGGKK